MSDFRKAYAGESMAVPRAKTPDGGSVANIPLEGLGGSVPVLRDGSGNIMWNNSLCVPNGATHKVTPRVGTPLPYVAPDGMGLKDQTRVIAATKIRQVPRT